MLTSLIKFFIDPFNIFWVLLLSIIGVSLLKKQRLARWLAVISGLWFLLISTPFLPTIVVDSLERQYEPIQIEDLADRNPEYHIIILGGGHGFDDRLPSNSLLSLNALGRLNEGIRLHRKLPNSKLVVSGFSSSGGTTQAEMLQQTALLLGVNQQSIITQKEPGNTYEEAKVYAQHFGNTHPLILVTSASHMPRAVRVFEYFGTEPIPSPTNYKLRGSWRYKRFGFPSMKNIENLRTGIIEYAGMLWYCLRE